MNLATQILLYGKPFRITDYFRMGQIGWHWQFDDPNTLYRQRNRLTYSRDFGNAAWTKAAILSVTADADGVGDLVVPNTTLTTHTLAQTTVMQAGVQNTHVIRAKAGGYNFIGITFGGLGTTYYDIGTGAVAFASPGMTASVAAASGVPGYYDCTVSGIPTTAVLTVFLAVSSGGVSFAGDGTSGVYIARAQLETYTTTPTEYQDVPTTWAQAYLDAVGADRIYAWKDTAGTDPVTAVGEGIGLLLGREYGGATGPSLLANGTAGLTGTATAASYSTTTFAGSVSRAGDASNQSWVTWTGLTTSAVYRIRVTNTGATSLDVRNGGVAGTIVASIAAGASTWVHPATTGGSTSITITATANSTTATFTLGQFAVLPGTHLTQATGTARPTLSARVNILRDTETLTAATWTKTNVSVAASPATDPNGGLKAFRITATAGNGFAFQSNSLLVSGAPYKNRMFVRRVSGTGVVKFFGPDGSSYTDITAALTTSWAEFTYSGTQPGVAYGPFVQLATSGDVVDVAFPDCRTADDAAKNLPAYQRVGATASDHDTDGYPHFAEGDGTDNAWASVATVDGSATDKLTVVAAVTKNSDAAGGILIEHTASYVSNAGSFYITAPEDAGTNRFATVSRGDAAALSTQRANATGSAYLAPISAVIGATHDIAADRTALELNGAAISTATSDKGAGNFANATLYVLSRAGSSVRFNGRFYGSTGRFGPMSDSERNNLTRWWQKRIGTA